MTATGTGRRVWWYVAAMDRGGGTTVGGVPAHAGAARPTDATTLGAMAVDLVPRLGLPVGFQADDGTGRLVVLCPPAIVEPKRPKRVR